MNEHLQFRTLFEYSSRSSAGRIIERTVAYSRSEGKLGNFRFNNCRPISDGQVVGSANLFELMCTCPEFATTTRRKFIPQWQGRLYG